MEEYDWIAEPKMRLPDLVERFRSKGVGYRVGSSQDRNPLVARCTMMSITPRSARLLAQAGR